MAHILLVEDDEMNRDMDFIYGFKRWLTRHPKAALRERTPV